MQLRLPPKLLSALKELAKHEDLTLEQLIRRLIIEAIDTRSFLPPSWPQTASLPGWAAKFV